jgi:putative transposase
VRRFDAALGFVSPRGSEKRQKRRYNAAVQDREEDGVNELRVQLIERLCRLPEAQLTKVEALLLSLESATVTPLQKKTAESAGPDGMPHRDWPHAPVHRLSEHGTFIVTASTAHKNHFFQGKERLTLLHDHLLRLAKQHDVVLEAWAVFSNHYHFVAHTNGQENQLAQLITRLHSDTAQVINRDNHNPGRPVWFNYWDTCLTFEKSYLARLSYVHHNAVKHGLVRRANEYPWCSAAWFERTATRAQIKTVYGFKIDRVKVQDDFEPVL